MQQAVIQPVARVQPDVTIRLFGPVATVVDGSVPAVWPSKKTAAILGYLACHLDQPVGRQRLVEVFWPDADQSRALHNLRQVLYKLREKLAETGPNGASMTSDGHVIRLFPGSTGLDVSQFQSSMSQAERARDDVTRTRHLFSAISHYHGAFLEGSEESWVIHQRNRFANLFCQAACDLSEALCQSDRAKEAVAVGQRALGHHPHRQDLHVALMRAFAYSGEIDCALRQFDVLERMLDDEFGEPPSQMALQALHTLPRPCTTQAGQPDRFVVAGATSLQAAPKSDISIDGPLLGRGDELKRLTELLVTDDPSGARIVSVTGVPGIGKSRLVAGFVETWPESFGPKWVVSVGSSMDRASLLSLIGESVSTLKRRPAADEQSVAHAIGPRVALLVLDDCDLSAEVLRETLPELVSQCPELRVLITTNAPLRLPSERLFPLHPLELPVPGSSLAQVRDNPSVALLCRSARMVHPDWKVTSETADDVVELVRFLDGLPLLLRIAGRHLAVMTPSELLSSLQEHRAELVDHTAPKGSKHDRFGTALRWTFDRLDDEARTALADLCRVPGSLSLGVCHLLWGDRCVPILESLLQGGWILRHDDGRATRFRLLGTVRESVRQMLGLQCLEPDRRAQLLEHFVSWCTDRSALLVGTFADSSRAELDNELSWVLGIMQDSCAHNDCLPQRLGVLACLDLLVAQIARDNRWVEVARSSVAEAVSSSELDLSRAAVTLGQFEFSARDFAAAETAFELAIARCPGAGQSLAWAAATNGIAVARRAQGRLEGTDVDLLNILESADLTFAPVLEWKVLMNLGVSLDWMGRREQALDAFDKARSTARRAGDLRLEAASLEALAQLRDLTPPSSDQLQLLEEAVSVIGLTGDERMKHYARANLGLALALAGRVQDGLLLLVECAQFDLLDQERWSLDSNIAAIALCAYRSGHNEIGDLAILARSSQQSPPNPHPPPVLVAIEAALAELVPKETSRQALQKPIGQALEQIRSKLTMPCSPDWELTSRGA